MWVGESRLTLKADIRIGVTQAIQIAPDLSHFWVYGTEIARVSASYAGCSCASTFEETLASQFPTATSGDFADALRGIAADCRSAA